MLALEQPERFFINIIDHDGRNCMLLFRANVNSCRVKLAPRRAAVLNDVRKAIPLIGLLHLPLHNLKVEPEWM